MADYHVGEIAVQKQAGTFMGKASGIGSKMNPAFRKFLQAQTLAVAASVDAAGQVWASALAGQAGFMQATSAEKLQIATQPVSGDPLTQNLKIDGRIGLLVIQFATRGRIRLNGRATLKNNGLEVQMDEVFGNCQQYIQARRAEFSKPTSARSEAHASPHLNATQQSWIAQADTFFIASANPVGGLDVSHRGGQPGFVRLLDEHTLVWPDYAGNGMFQTLGNLAVNPQAGLLFMDFTGGHVLQLTGQAEIVWDSVQAVQFPGAERLIIFRVKQALAITHAIPLTYEFMSYSPYNPR